MATFRQTLKHGLLTCPTIFLNPIDVAEHLFAVIGNGFEWYDGEMIDPFDRGPEVTTMKYPAPRDHGTEHEGLEKFYAGLRLQDEAERIRMKFTEDNIDAMVDGYLTNIYFGSSKHSTYITRDICTKYADGLKFPDNIKEDWAKGLYTFLNYWLHQLNSTYGTGTKENPFAGWPADVKEAYDTIMNARYRLHPFVYNGRTYEEDAQRSRELMKTIWEDLKLDNK